MALLEVRDLSVTIGSLQPLDRVRQRRDDRHGDR